MSGSKSGLSLHLLPVFVKCEQQTASCASSSEPLLLTYAISINITCSVFAQINQVNSYPFLRDIITKLKEGHQDLRQD